MGCLPQEFQARCKLSGRQLGTDDLGTRRQSAAIRAGERDETMQQARGRYGDPRRGKIQ